MSPLHLGDPALTRKMTRIYGWILPGCFAAVTLLLLLAQAWLAAIPPLLIVSPLLSRNTDHSADSSVELSVMPSDGVSASRAGIASSVTTGCSEPS